MRIVSAVIAALALTLAAIPIGRGLVGQPAAGLETMSPQGSAEGVEQVRLSFRTAMVPLGDPRLPAPASLSCPGLAGRWADERTYLWDSQRPLPGGLRCHVTLRAGLADAAGAPVPQQGFAFDTGGPTVVAALPGEDGMVEEDQLFLLALNAAATPRSIAADAACVIDGIGEAVPLDVQPDAVRDRLLSEAGDGWQVQRFLARAGWRADPYDPQAKLRARAPVLAARCRRALPAGGQVGIVWGGGVATPGGLATGATRRLDYRVRSAFTARFACERAKAAAGCLPLKPLRLEFSAPVPRGAAAAARLVGPGGASLAPTLPEKAAFVESVEWRPPLAESAAYGIELPAGLADQSGRRLENAARFPLPVRTGEAPPIVKFAGTFGILEAEEGGVLPVTVRGVEAPLTGRRQAVAGQALKADASDGEVAAWLRRLERAEEREFRPSPVAGDRDREVEVTRSRALLPAGGAARALSVPAAHGQAFQVVGIPLGAPGFYVVELASPRLGAALLRPGRTRHVATGALVTNMAVHFQWGRGRSLAWVTRLDDARPVAGARVRVTNSCTGAALWQGRTDASGRAAIAGLPDPSGYGSCERGGEPPLMVSARDGDDFSFTLTSWNQGIQPGDFNLPTGWGAQDSIHHTVFDRTLLRAGETVRMKHIARGRGDAGFSFLEPLPGQQVAIRHLGSGTAYTLPLAFRADGSAETVWRSPAEAQLGDYEVAVGPPGAEAASGAFAIEEYRLPLMRALVSGPKGRLVRPAAVPLDLFLGYMSGGPAGGAAVKLRMLVRPRAYENRDHPDFSFEWERVAPGIEALGEDGEGAAAPLRPRLLPLTLAGDGTARAVVDGIGAVERPSELVAEMDYEDPNGETLTATRTIPLEPSRGRVGIATDGWIMKADDVRLRVVALDLEGKPLRGQRVSVALFSREVNSTRRRLIGGFYAYDNNRETKRLGADCEETTDANGLARCALDAGVSGEVIAVATARDAQGNVTTSTRSVWLAGDDDWWFGGDNGDRMDVIAEQPEVAAGGVARFQVRMPFRRATALVSVLRDGVIDSFVTELSGRDPVVALRMKPGMAPNAYVSVLAVRGRVAGWRLWLAELARRWNLPWISRDAAAPTALVDLAKPSYRLGMARVRVGWEEHRLDVAVRPSGGSFAARARAPVRLEVAGPGGRPLPAGAEVAVAAVDESLLSLKDNDSWKLLDAMMAERPLFVWTATAQGQVVGKRHYGLKAVPSGGGGGADAGALVRRDFDPVLLWRGRVPLDAQGRAQVTVPLNDSLSSFRVVAVATAGAGLFGTGSAVIRTAQDLQLLSGVPPVARSGDSYAAVVTVRNASGRAMQATVQATVQGSAGALTLPPQRVALAAGAAAAVAWNVVAPAPGAVRWNIRVAAGASADRVQVTQTVLPAVPTSTWGQTLLRLDGPGRVPLAAPAGALPGAEARVQLSRSLAGGSLAGARAWMAAYPWTCLEQDLARAVVLGDRGLWDRQMALLPRYLDADGLARFFPADWIAGDEQLTAHILSLSAEAGWAIPAASRERMLDGLAAFAEGRLARSNADALIVEKGAGPVGRGGLSEATAARRIAAVAALARYGRARAAMLDPVSVAPNAWPTPTLLDWMAALRAVADVPDAPARLAAAEQVLRSRLDYSGTTLAMARSDDLWWLLQSGDSTAARLLLMAVDRPEWRGDIGRLARATVGRQRRGAWDTTVANAWGTLALQRFAARFEAVPVAGAASVALGGVARSVAFPAAGDPPAVAVPLPAGQSVATLAHGGAGAPWATVAVRAAVPLRQPLAAGFGLSRSVTAVTQAVPGRWSRGDVMRVRLTIDSRAAIGWVALADPVPAGATILGGSLGGRSAMLDAGAEAGGVSFVERRADALHAYWETLPRGRTTYEYTLRLNTAGRFALPPTRVEAMYAPERFALLPNAPVVAR